MSMIDSQVATALFDELRALPGYTYLATPYSKYPDGIEAAFEEACRVTAYLIRNGVRVFCPIAHTHPVAMHGKIDPLSHDIWIPADAPLMDGATSLVVCMMESWRESYGIGVEIESFKAAGKPIFYMPWEDQGE